MFLRQFTRALPGATVEDGFRVRGKLRAFVWGLSRVQVIRVLLWVLGFRVLRFLLWVLESRFSGHLLWVLLGVQVLRILAVGLRVAGVAVGLRVQGAGRVQATYTIFYLSHYIRLFHGCT